MKLQAKRLRSRGIALALSAASLLAVALAHSHDGHNCIHDSVIDAAGHEHDNEPVRLLQEAEDGSEPTAVTMTRRELETLPELAGVREEHSRRLQSNTASYLARPWGGLRIHVEFVDVTGPGQDPTMTAQKANLLQNQIIPGVVAKLRAVLEVRGIVRCGAVCGCWRWPC